jgi:GNAT superfamily N-acetyltransferase
MQITYRPARADDLEPATRIVQDAYNDLRERHGLPPSIALGPPLFPIFSLAERSSSLWVAEAEGTLQGFAFSWMRQRFWFLAQLFVRPGLQSKGIGQAMISRTLRHAEENGAENRALITMAYNTASTGLYVRNGLYPREPLLRLTAPVSVLKNRIVKSGVAAVPIEPWPGPCDWLARIDEEVLGFRRESHHAFLLGGVAAVSLLIEQAGKPVGYAYISPAGHIGPLAMLPGTDAQSVLAAVSQRALDVQPKQVSLVIPGRADRMLDAAFQLGFRIDEPFVLLSAQPFGDWSHYLPSNPGFM